MPKILDSMPVLHRKACVWGKLWNNCLVFKLRYHQSGKEGFIFLATAVGFQEGKQWLSAN